MRQQFSSLGTLEQKAQSLSDLELNFNVSSDSGVPGALNALFQSFSSWSVTPDERASRQAVIDSAQTVAQAFQQASANVAKSFNGTGQQIQQTVSQINRSGGTVAGRQHAAAEGRHAQDAGLDAQMHSTLEQLSEFADITATTQPDGSVTVLLGGQTPLVIGAHQYRSAPVSRQQRARPPPSPAVRRPARILDAQGNDVTAHISQGKLAGLLDMYNNVLPSIGGNAYQQGDLNLLAQSVADRVNQILTSGHISDGPPPVAGHSAVHLQCRQSLRHRANAWR